MRDDTPSVYFLAGPDSPAKASYARTLRELGVAEVAAPSPSEFVASLVALVRSGRDAFIAREFPSDADRDRCKLLVEDHGGQWLSINFGIDHGPLAKGR
jgi:hypothetical protein